jgi:hypothetical protein
MSAYTKTIICLANSRKELARCVAGKEYLDGHFGGWIRPVSTRLDHAISEEDRRYKNGEYARVLHVVRIPMQRPAPDGFQQENHLIDDRYYWSREGALTWQQLHAAVDPIGDLWVNGYSTHAGINDRVPDWALADLRNSLALIGPLDVNFKVSAEGAAFGNDKRRVRAFFHHAGFSYGIAVTDPPVERQYINAGDGEYQVTDALLCVSLAQPWNGYAYKVVATVITPDRAP